MGLIFSCTNKMRRKTKKSGFRFRGVAEDLYPETGTHLDTSANKRRGGKRLVKKTRKLRNKLRALFSRRNTRQN